jgi:predicted ATPase
MEKKNLKEQPILSVKNLGQINSGTIEFGDLTLLVGPQASGKSILLQLLKLVVDRHNITDTLKTYGYDWSKNADKLLELHFGESMSALWRNETEVKFNQKTIKKQDFLPKQGQQDKTEKVFYIPAQRVVTMRGGWPQNFMAFETGDPYVLKSFSETLRVLMEKESANGNGSASVFPKLGRLKEPLRKTIDNSIFHGATVELDKSSLKKRFLLRVTDNSSLPFMAWSAGQKEFMPLLLSLYHLVPSSKTTQKEAIDWVILEEPEMGLHPQAIQAVMLLCLELIHRGYKVVISTHSTILLELAWTMNFIQTMNGSVNDLFELFDFSSKSADLKAVFKTVIEQKTFKTYYFNRTDKMVNIQDISSLDAGNEDRAISNWGGLSDFASRASDIISKLAANHE